MKFLLDVFKEIAPRIPTKDVGIVAVYVVSVGGLIVLSQEAISALSGSKDGLIE